MHFRQHPFADSAALDHSLHILARDGRQMAAVGITDSFHINHAIRWTLNLNFMSQVVTGLVAGFIHLAGMEEHGA